MDIRRTSTVAYDLCCHFGMTGADTAAEELLDVELVAL
jgi:hypothetical protein